MALVIVVVLQLILLGILVAIIVRWLSIGISSVLPVPFVPTSLRYAAAIDEALHITPGSVVYELGSGDGRILLYLARKHPSVRCVGIEKNPVLRAQAWVRWIITGRPKHVSFEESDLFAADLSKATHIYAYLTSDTVALRFPPGSFPSVRIVSRAFPLPERTPQKIVTLSKHIGSHGQHQLYVYD